MLWFGPVLLGLAWYDVLLFDVAGVGFVFVVLLGLVLCHVVLWRGVMLCGRV